MNYIELIKNFTKKDYETDVNLHVHTNCSDGKSTVEDILRWGKSKRYIAICDHNTLNAYLAGGATGENVIPAIEFDCWCGTVFLHMLGYGVDINNDNLKSLCAKTKRETEVDWIRLFSARNPKKIIDAIHSAGGIAVLAHPACCWAFNLDGFVKKLISFGLDGLEVFYPYHRHRGIIKFHTAKTVEKIADKYSLIKTGGTDLHEKV